MEMTYTRFLLNAGVRLNLLMPLRTGTFENHACGVRGSAILR